jgi:hypothetical protein
MNATQTILTFAETRNASLVAPSLHLNAFQLEGAERVYFLKDMYQIANETLNEMKGYDMDLGNLINQIAELANAA